MLSFSKRFIYALSNKIRHKKQDTSAESRLVVDFTKKQKSPFDIKSESSYNAYLSNSSLMLGMKKSNCIAWLDIPEAKYRDHVIKAKIRLDSMGGYASTGVIFRISGENSYYLALVSSKGYFRCDVIKDSAPRALIAWTEIFNFDETNIDLQIINYGTYIIFVANGKWLGEINDDSLGPGGLGFALASYETAGENSEPGQEKDEKQDDDTSNINEYTCKAYLDYFSVDARLKTIEEKFKKWTDDSNINAESRLVLAESFAVMGKPFKSLEQIRKAWKRRDDAIRSANVSDTEEVRTKKELILAARMASDLGQYAEAEKYIDLILDQWPSSSEGKSACIEKIKILNILNKYGELKEFLLKNTETIEINIEYYTMLGRCYFELKEYADSARQWEKAFQINGENGVYAVNAANALGLAGKKEEALPLFLEAGKIFLKQDNRGELNSMMPKLSLLGGKNWEARTLAGKWAFSIEDYDRSVNEFSAAEKLRCALKPRPKADPALFYLWGLVLSIKGKNKDAVRLLERAVKLAPDYGMFRFKLAELKLTSGVKDPNIVKDLKLALEYIDDDMKEETANRAGNLLLKTKNKKNAGYFFNIAKKE
jgi:tetratricopeptide (TPR) repeat protein